MHLPEIDSTPIGDMLDTHEQLAACLVGHAACKGCEQLGYVLREVTSAFDAVTSSARDLATRAQDAVASASQFHEFHTDATGCSPDFKGQLQEIRRDMQRMFGDAAATTTVLRAIMGGVVQCPGQSNEGCGLSPDQQRQAFWSTPTPLFIDGERVA